MLLREGPEFGWGSLGRRVDTTGNPDASPRGRPKTAAELNADLAKAAGRIAKHMNEDHGASMLCVCILFVVLGTFPCALPFASPTTR